MTVLHHVVDVCVCSCPNSRRAPVPVRLVPAGSDCPGLPAHPVPEQEEVQSALPELSHSDTARSDPEPGLRTHIWVYFHSYRTLIYSVMLFLCTDAALVVKRQEAMEAARMKMQEELDAKAEVFRERQRQVM